MFKVYKVLTKRKYINTNRHLVNSRLILIKGKLNFCWYKFAFYEAAQYFHVS